MLPRNFGVIELLACFAGSAAQVAELTAEAVHLFVQNDDIILLAIVRSVACI
jgi:hypothetical protein